MPVICPRCGRRGYAVERRVGGRAYVYVEHYEGGTRVRSCYVGPRDRYEHAGHLLGLGITNLMSQDYAGAIIDLSRSFESWARTADPGSVEEMTRRVCAALEEWRGRLKCARRRAVGGGTRPGGAP
ncbi:MAG: hypothetical protein ACP5NG_03945 [Conexivisphaera sp.]